MPVIIQDDMYEAAAMMTKKQGSEFLLALLHYGFTGEEPEGKPSWLPTFITCKYRIPYGGSKPLEKSLGEDS